jgi:hypothetical protein
MPSDIDPLAALLEGDPPVPVGDERHCILLSPSFHRDVLLTIDLGPRPSARARTYEGRVYMALLDHRAACRRARSDHEASLLAPNLPRHHEARAALTPARAEQLRRDLARDLPGLSVRDERVGRDGIGLTVEVRRADAPPLRFAAWSPEADDPQHAYFATVHALAAEVFARDEHTTLHLDHIHGYLDLGLPARDRGGYPRCLQIFGRLAGADERALAALFATPKQTEAVVVDMRTFEFMAPELHPLFHGFSRRPGATGWAVSASARRALKAAQVPTHQMRDDLSDAILLVTVHDARR